MKYLIYASAVLVAVTAGFAAQASDSENLHHNPGGRPRATSVLERARQFGDVVPRPFSRSVGALRGTSGVRNEPLTLTTSLSNSPSQMSSPLLSGVEVGRTSAPTITTTAQETAYHQFLDPKSPHGLSLEKISQVYWDEESQKEERFLAQQVRTFGTFLKKLSKKRYEKLAQIVELEAKNPSKKSNKKLKDLRKKLTKATKNKPRILGTIRMLEKTVAEILTSFGENSNLTKLRLLKLRSDSTFNQHFEKKPRSASSASSDESENSEVESPLGSDSTE